MSVLENSRASVALRDSGRGPGVVVVVSGSEADRQFWSNAVSRTAADVFRADGSSEIISIAEGQRKGNFLGTLNAWQLASTELEEVPGLALLTMVFGQGKRLSPFTQALGDRKSAFPSPRAGEQSKSFLSAADISNLYTNLWFDHLDRAGFRGVLVKWGDEAVIPSAHWTVTPGALADADAVRFIWVTEPDATLASQKDWIAVDGAGDMLQMIPRQKESDLRAELARRHAARVGVNLGSLAVSHELLAAAQETFANEIATGAWIDWDPYVWIALFTESAEEWGSVRERERSRGSDALTKLEERVPQFYENVRAMKGSLESVTGRPLRVATLDFGTAFWLDFGLQKTLQTMLSKLTDRSEEGQILRSLFGLPEAFDERGNILIRSTVADGARIESSVLIDTDVRSPESVLYGAVIVGSDLGEVVMREGGAIIECDATRVLARGPRAIAFRVVDETIDLNEGDRLSAIYVRPGVTVLRSNESISDADETYDAVVMGNNISFAEAGRRAGASGWEEQFAMWTEARAAFRNSGWSVVSEQ